MMADLSRTTPLVIGGVGGSGTRLIAAILQQAGVFIGDQLNGSLDNVALTPLFAGTRQLLQRASAGRFRPGLACPDYVLTYGEDIESFVRREAAAFERDMHSAIGRQLPRPTAWGWKGPPSFHLLEPLQSCFGDLRYVHVVRHGVDMAFSSNQNQLVRWGWRFGLPPVTGPANAFTYWVHANRQAMFDVQRLGIRHLLVNFDLLCDEPRRQIAALLKFANLDADVDFLGSLVRKPETVGRRKSRETEFVGRDGQEALGAFGFEP